MFLSFFRYEAEPLYSRSQAGAWERVLGGSCLPSKLRCDTDTLISQQSQTAQGYQYCRTFVSDDAEGEGDITGEVGD